MDQPELKCILGVMSAVVSIRRSVYFAAIVGYEEGGAGVPYAEFDILRWLGGLGGASHTLEGSSFSVDGVRHSPLCGDADLEKVKGRLEGGTSFFGDAPRFFYCVHRGTLDGVEELGLVVREPSELRGVKVRVFASHGVGVHGLLGGEGAFFPTQVQTTVNGVSVVEGASVCFLLALACD